MLRVTCHSGRMSVFLIGPQRPDDAPGDLRSITPPRPGSLRLTVLPPIVGLLQVLPETENFR